MDEGESVLMNEECPHPLPEEELQRGQTQRSLRIEQAIFQLEGVIDTLRGVVEGDTNNLN